MNQIIVTNSPAFLKLAENSDLKRKFEENELPLFLSENLKPPFGLDPGLVFGVVAGDKKIGAEEISNFPNLKIIARFGKGIDNIDRTSAKSRNIIITNVPSSGARAVAELTLAFLFALSRNIFGFNDFMKGRKWERFYGQGLCGKNLGIIGLGAIGKEVAKAAKNFGMNVGVFDVNCDRKCLNGLDIEEKDFEVLLKTSDFISLHVPLTDQTKNLINKEAFSMMRPGAYLINTSRGEVLEEKSLLEALTSGKIAGAALDVFSKEPPFEDEVLNQIISHPKVISTPHIGGFTLEAHHNAALRVFENIMAVKNGKLSAADIC